MCSISYTDLSQNFINHFTELSTKQETIQPFFTEDVKANFNEKLVNGKAAVIQDLAPYLPFSKPSAMTHEQAYQPFKDGSLITFKPESKKGHVILTFELTEVKQDKKDDQTVHIFGINKFLLLPAE